MKKTAFIILSILMVLSSCVSSNFSVNEDEEGEGLEEPAEEGEEETAQEDLPVVYKNAFTLSMRNPKTLNPILNEDVTVDSALKLIFEHVVIYNENLEPVPNLLESIRFSEDGLTMTAWIRQDIYWSDGNAINADDLIFTLDMIKNTASAASMYKDIARNISSYTKLGSREVAISLTNTTGGLPYNLCFPLLPAHYYGGQTDPESEKNMAPLGCGPYIFEKYILVNEMSLRSNTSYFKGRPAIEEVSVIITSNTETDFYAFEQSVIDILTADVLDWGKYSGTKQAIITEFSTNYYDFVGFNMKTSIELDDRRVREAIAHCFDIDWAVDSIYLGHAVKTATVINPASWAYEDDVAIYDYDKALALSLLSNAGYAKNGETGVLSREIGGMLFELRLRLLVNEENAERMELARHLQSNLEEIGINVDLIAVDFDTYMQRLRNGEFDLFVGGFNFSPMPSLSFAFASSQTEVGSNYFGYRSETLDSYLAAAASAADRESFKKALSDIQKHIANELPCISVVFRKSALLSDEKVKGDKIPLFNDVYNNVNDWYINRSEF